MNTVLKEAVEKIQAAGHHGLAIWFQQRLGSLKEDARGRLACRAALAAWGKGAPVSTVALRAIAIRAYQQNEEVERLVQRWREQIEERIKHGQLSEEEMDRLFGRFMFRPCPPGAFEPRVVTGSLGYAWRLACNLAGLHQTDMEVFLVPFGPCARDLNNFACGPKIGDIRHEPALLQAAQATAVRPLLQQR